MASKPAAGKSGGEKRKRVVLTLKEKIDICTRLEKGESRKALMQEYNVGMSALYDIRAHKAQLASVLRQLGLQQGTGAAAHAAHAQAGAPGPRPVRVVPGEAFRGRPCVRPHAHREGQGLLRADAAH
uniref:Macaca fascicularis brain cDNA clone: QflA-23707, similar to human jerky homolog (mouse) (JRK), mRNA, RefSeq: NM_003724.1 n=1 Tax=Macaca fascicularis TaxID=9541 RepID=I7GMU7_MACFA|nr:unnamed protein product [Macaca fascicularis]